MKRKGLKILVVEDDEISAKTLVRHLGGVGKCVVVHDGKAAIEALKKAYNTSSPFQLICLDMVLPSLSGPAIMRDLRAYEEDLGIELKKRAKIIVISGVTDAKSVVAAFQDGCEAYLSKPINKSELIIEIKKLELSNT